jgi:HNH endonuclease
MATKPLERLLFLQGGLCFFCSQPLPQSEASIEHLQAVATGGTNHDDNCVACCKAVNRALGSMPLKAKIQVLLNQRGIFKCPNPRLAAELRRPVASKPAKATKPDTLTMVADNLRQRGASRPRTVKALISTIAALLKQHKRTESAASVVDKLSASGKLTIAAGKVTYDL